MARVVLVVSALLMFLASQTGGAFAAPAKNACLSCHTNGAMMKALYKPPVLESGEAEG